MGVCVCVCVCCCFFILFSTKFYLNWKSVPTCAWHLIFCWPTGSAQCPPIHDTGYSLLSKNPCPPVHDTWFLIYRLGKPSVHLYMTLSLYPPWAKKPVPSCAWHLVFLLNNWASPVPTYTWHWLTLFEFFFKKPCPPVHDTWYYHRLSIELRYVCIA